MATRFEMRCGSSRAYTVSVVDGAFCPGESPLSSLFGGRRALVITTPTVDRLYGEGLRRWAHTVDADIAVAVVPLTEQNKSMDSVLELCDAAARAGLRRHDALVAFGGGVCCDVVTVAAGLIRRGIPYVCVPTTLVGQIDAGIGLKGAVNRGGKKSSLGSFTPPEAVVVDPGLLLSLPAAALRAGLAEILKMALIRDAELFDLLAAYGASLVESRFGAPATVRSEVMTRAIELMLDELASNCYEDRTLMRRVDFGHTFSPALEELSLYHLPHGLAVSLDMALSCAIAVELGWLDPITCRRVLEVFRALGLPTWSPLVSEHAIQRAVSAATEHRAGELNLVLPVAVGKAEFVRRSADLPASSVAAAIDRVRSHANSTRRSKVSRSVAVVSGGFVNSRQVGRGDVNDH